MIGIRADANSEIGTGHVMRCLSIAVALQKCGQEVCFILADEAAADLLETKGQKYLVLHSDYTQMEAEVPKLCRALEENSMETLLIDSYFVTAEYLEQVGKIVRTVYMDDLNMIPYPVDVVVNYNIYGDLLPYKENAVKETTQFLLGTAYAPLREEFQHVEYAVRDVVQNVLVTTGGADKYNLAGQILQKVLQYPVTKDLQYHVVSGAFNQNFPALQELAGKYANVHIHQNVTKMAELMKNCDVAITAGGSTMYELSAVGVPIICFSFAENQEQLVQTFVRKQKVCFGGNYLTERQALFDHIAENLGLLIVQNEIREKYSKAGRTLVDGQGTLRIARAICELTN